jgi:hypothetical protein
MVTARKFAQTTELLDLWKIPHRVVGIHGGKSKIHKVINLLQRSSQLDRAIRGHAIGLAVSHGSRTQLLVSKRRGIDSVLMLDYEHTEARIFNALATHLLMPRHLPEHILRSAGFRIQKVLRYDGFKEELYLEDFVPTMRVRELLGIPAEAILVTVRPPSMVGNYHDPKSEELYRSCLDHFASVPQAVCLIVNRTPAEASLVSREIRHLSNVRVLDRPVDGLQLLWNSDIVVSGGGTMNRESALLGVPTYSIFTGKRPFLDQMLHEQGRLAFVSTPREVQVIPVTRWPRPASFTPRTRGLASSITDLLLDLAKRPHP